MMKLIHEKSLIASEVETFEGGLYKSAEETGCSFSSFDALNEVDQSPLQRDIGIHQRRTCDGPPWFHFSSCI